MCQLCCNPGHTIEECYLALQPTGSNEQACFTQGYGQQIYDDHFNPQNQKWRQYPNNSWGQPSQRVNSTPPTTRPPTNQYSSNRPSFPQNSYHTPTPSQPHYPSPQSSSQANSSSPSDPTLQTILKCMEGQIKINEEHSKQLQYLGPSIAKLEAQVGQLANQPSRRDRKSVV